MSEPKKLLLASQSPRRKQLLELAALPFDVFAAETDESYPSGLVSVEVPLYIAGQKARTVQEKFPDRCILAADTLVILEDQIVGKPLGREDAIHILNSLSGHTHTVITGVVITEQQQICRFSESTEETFHSLKQEEIIYYVDQYQPWDKAGAYAIQEWIGAVAIQKIAGCFYNVMGLPISRVYQELREFGLQPGF